MVDATFALVRAAGEAGQLGLRDWVRVRGCLDFAVLAYGAPLDAIDADPADFDSRWAATTPPDPLGPFRSAVQYRTWRTSVLAALEAHAGQRAASTVAVESSKTDWRRLQDLLLVHGTLDQRNAIAVLGARARERGRALAAVDRSWALATQDALDGSTRLGFRRGLAILDALHAVPAVTASGLLPPTIGTLPMRPGPRKPRPLPAPLQDLFDRFVAANPGMKAARRLRARGALGWAWLQAEKHALVAKGGDPLDLATREGLAALDRIHGDGIEGRATPMKGYGPSLRAIFALHDHRLARRR